jgi:hypothetical protein
LCQVDGCGVMLSQRYPFIVLNEKCVKICFEKTVLAQVLATPRRPHGMENNCSFQIPKLFETVATRNEQGSEALA